MRRWICALALTLALAAPAQAQSTRSGLWGGFGFGPGTLSCLDDCDDRIEGASGYGVIGGTLSDYVRIGGGGTFFNREEDGMTLNFETVLFIVQFFPGAGDFYLQAGGGFSTAKLEFSFGTLDDEGSAFLVGLGYDIDLGAGKISLVPFANWVVSSIEATPEMFQLGLGIVWN